MHYFLRLALISILLSPLTLPASAHRAQLSITTLEWVSAGTVIEVTHRIHLHDAQDALRASDQSDAEHLDILDLEAQARFALYAEDRFALYPSAAAQTPVPVTTVGAEVDGEYLYVYQEITNAPAMLAVSLSCDILRDVFPGYGNHVNLQQGATVQTLTFSGDDNRKSINPQ